MKGKLLLAALVLLGGCAKVPDFMVEGRLPHFGDGADQGAPQMAQAPAAAAPATAPEPARDATPAASPPASAAPPASPPAPAMAMVDTPHGRDAPAPAPEAARAKPVMAAPVMAAPAAPVTTAPPIVGGFQPATDKAAVELAAAFAVHESPGYVLKSIKSARTQVVAGVNYDLCLKVRTPGHEASWVRQRLVRARVFQALDQHMELSSWQEVDSCE